MGPDRAGCPEGSADGGALTEPVLERGTLLVDRYRIEGVLGTGGMGRVYRARDEALGCPVALKLMHAAMIAQAGRFEREARAGAALTHPAVVRVLAFGRLDDGRPYLVFEFVEGESVSARLRAAGPIEPERALTLMRPIAGALARAHAAGVIHRDLKPENLLWTQAAGMPEMLRLLDFGIAGLSTEDEAPPTEKLTVTGQVFGTPEYMAPEQAMGRRTTPATDVWAFGATLHALLTGVSPFAGAHVPEILYRVVNAPPPPLPEAVSPELAALVTRCLAKAPADRPADGAELLACLPSPPSNHVARGSVGQGRPPPSRTPPRSLLLALAVGLGGGVGLGVLASGEQGSRPAPAASEPDDPARDANAGEAASRRQAIVTLLTAGRIAEAVPRLRAHLADTPVATEDAELVTAVVDAFATRDGASLAEFLGGPLMPAARVRLLALAAHPEPRVRWRAARTFAPDSADARTARIEALRQDLRLGDCDVRKRTLGELVEMGDPAVIPDIRAMRQRFNFLDNLCLGDADEAAIRRLRK